MYIDEVSKQKVALQILGKCFAVRGGKDYLSFFFEEYDVSLDFFFVVCNLAYIVFI